MQKNDELHKKIDNLMGKFMGLQTLMISTIAASGHRAEITKHFVEEAEFANEQFIASRLPDEALESYRQWVNTTLMLLQDESEDL